MLQCANFRAFLLTTSKATYTVFKQLSKLTAPRQSKIEATCTASHTRRWWEIRVLSCRPCPLPQVSRPCPHPKLPPSLYGFVRAWRKPRNADVGTTGKAVQQANRNNRQCGTTGKPHMAVTKHGTRRALSRLPLHLPSYLVPGGHCHCQNTTTHPSSK